MMFWVAIKDKKPRVDESSMSKEIKTKVEQIGAHQGSGKENHVSFYKKIKDKAQER